MGRAREYYERAIELGNSAELRAVENMQTSCSLSMQTLTRTFKM
jgi:hypothetical protein